MCDVFDPASVQAAVEGCHSIVNAAAVHSLDPGEGKHVLGVNPRPTEIVLETAARASLDPIIHLSSYVALLPSDAVLGTNSPVGEKRPADPRLEAESELIARHHQDAGAPVVTTCRGTVVGPMIRTSETAPFTIAMILRNQVPFALGGGWPVADVRYVAAAHASMLTLREKSKRILSLRY